ncbi:MAG: protein kinase [Myxococcota bacterium]
MLRIVLGFVALSAIANPFNQSNHTAGPFGNSYDKPSNGLGFDDPDFKPPFHLPPPSDPTLGLLAGYEQFLHAAKKTVGMLFAGGDSPLAPIFEFGDTVAVDIGGISIAHNVIPVSSDSNNCFFAALQTAGISLSRAAAIEILEQVEEPRLKAIIVSYIKSFPAYALLKDSEIDVRSFLLDNFGAPADALVYPMIGFRLDGVPSLIDVLAEVLQIKIQIFDQFGQMMSQTISASDSHDLRVIRLLYQSSHFDLLQPRVVGYTGAAGATPYVTSLPPLGGGTYGLVYPGTYVGSNKPIAVKALGLSIKRLWSEILFCLLPEHPGLMRSKGYSIELPQYDVQIAFDRMRCSLAVGANCKLLLFEHMIVVMEAVHHLHTIGIAHRDLKPANILITNEGNLILADMGSAAISTGYGCFEEATTIHYASPEHCAKLYAFKPNDVWSLGVILTEIFLGQNPFKLNPHPPNTTTYEQGNFTLKKLPTVLDSIKKDVPADIADLIEKMLNKDGESRIDMAGVLNHPAVAKFRKGKVLRIPKMPVSPETLDQNRIQRRLAVLPGFLNICLSYLSQRSVGIDTRRLSNASLGLHAWLAAVVLQESDRLVQPTVEAVADAYFDHARFAAIILEGAELEDTHVPRFLSMLPTLSTLSTTMRRLAQVYEEFYAYSVRVDAGNAAKAHDGWHRRSLFEFLENILAGYRRRAA